MKQLIRQIGLSILLLAGSVFTNHALAHENGIKTIASSNKQWTGVAVSNQGRVFVNFPKWSDNVPVSVAEIIDGKAVAYPNKKWNNSKKTNAFVAVQSVVIDKKDRLWVLDTRNPQFNGVLKGGPVLYQFNLKTDKKEAEFHFPKGVYMTDSYFNDVRIDTQKEIAYMTDSGNGALIIIDLKTKKSKRVLDNHFSTHSEVDFLKCNGKLWRNSVHSDGIALTPNREYLYYIALTGHTLYRIKTDDLNNFDLSDTQLAEAVETVQTIPATDGMLFDNTGNLWLGGLEDNSVNILKENGKLVKAIQNESIRWADSFAQDSNGNIYFTTSQIHLAEETRSEYQVLSINPSHLREQQIGNKILIAITSHGVLGENEGEPTGYFLSEVSHAYYAFKKAGFHIDFVSPKGGKAPVTGVDLKDVENKQFVNDSEAQKAIDNSLKASEVDPTDYQAIYYAGGHGVMWDFPNDVALQNLSTSIYEKGGVVSAVCHGPAALVNIKLSNGKYLVDGKRVSTFTNEEEAAIKLEKVVPFTLETQLIDRGVTVEKVGLFKEKVVVDRRLVTGQNPASAKAVAREVIDLLK